MKRFQSLHSAAGSFGLTLLLGTLAAPGTHAEKLTTFSPDLYVSGAYTDHVSLGGGVGTGDGEYTTNLSLSMRLVRLQKKGRIQLDYTPSYERHGTYSELDSDEHRFGFRFQHTPREDLAFEVRSGYSRSQASPGGAGAIDSEELGETDINFLAFHAEVESYSLVSRMRKDFRSRWNWDVAMSATTSDATPVGDAPMGAFDDLEGKSTYDLQSGLMRQITRRIGFGVVTGFSYYDLDESPSAVAQRLYANVTHQVTQQFRMGLRVGTYSQKSDGADRNGGFSGIFSMERQFRSAYVAVALSQDLTGGGNIAGLSVNRNGIVRVAGEMGTYWGWNVYGLYGKWYPENTTTSERITTGAGFGVDFRPRSPLGLQLTTSYLEREYLDLDGSTIEGISGDYRTTVLSLVWRMPGVGRQLGA